MFASEHKKKGEELINEMNQSHVDKEQEVWTRLKI